MYDVFDISSMDNYTTVKNSDELVITFILGMGQMLTA